jgi:Zn-dependent peptidase ImmA (M78 family)
MPSFEKIEKEAARVAREAGVEGVFPVPLEQIAKWLGYTPLTFDGEDDLSGAIQHENKQIFVNRRHHVTRQRFTMAHEIGHAVLHGDQGSILDYRKTMNSPDRKEMEANRFAADLLMPGEMFRAVFLSRGGDMKRVAAYFGVSEEAAKFRRQNVVV